MEIPVYLAMTAAEFRTCSPLPPHPAWLSCLFSPYGRGLSNIPKQLPPGSLLILSDRTPIRGHDPELIYQTLAEAIPRLSCSGLLLDFEGPTSPESMELVRTLTSLPFPVAVASNHAEEMDCPVFIPYLPPSEHLQPHIEPWKGREIWLEVSTSAQEITVTPSGVTVRNAPTPYHLPHKDQDLFCHYGIDVEENAITFTLQRTLQDISDLLEARKPMGVSRGIGFYREFK